jgi:hypothetical protein
MLAGSVDLGASRILDCVAVAAASTAGAPAALRARLGLPLVLLAPGVMCR